MPLASDYFNWKGLLIRQDESVHKVGTDAITLGSWIPTIISQTHSILDVGTGSGILALWMAKCFPEAIIHAIDIDPKAVSLAQFNSNQAISEGRVEVTREDLLGSAVTDSQYDLVMSNPPYHPEQIFPKKEFKRVAKHLNTSIGDWIKAFARRMTPEGHLMLIVPYESAARWIASANENDLHNHHRLDVFSYENDHEPKRSLLHLTKDLAKPVFNRLIIYQQDKTYTADYLQLTGIGQYAKPPLNEIQ